MPGARIRRRDDGQRRPVPLLDEWVEERSPPGVGAGEARDPDITVRIRRRAGERHDRRSVDRCRLHLGPGRAGPVLQQRLLHPRVTGYSDGPDVVRCGRSHTLDLAGGAATEPRNRALRPLLAVVVLGERRVGVAPLVADGPDVSGRRRGDRGECPCDAGGSGLRDRRRCADHARGERESGGGWHQGAPSARQDAEVTSMVRSLVHEGRPAFVLSWVVVRGSAGQPPMATDFQDVPFQCSATGSLNVPPTIHASLADSADTPPR